METDREIVRGPGNSRNQLPVWMYENTSFESKYMDDDEGEEESPTPFPHDFTQNSDDDDELPEVYQNVPIPSCEDPSCLEILKTVETSLSTWITGDQTNISVEFKGLMTPYKYLNAAQQQHSYPELQDLEQLVLQLNLELLNVFDNYLCFSGRQDSSHMIRLSALAYSRASENLDAKRHCHAPATQKLLSLAYEKLCQFYSQQNAKIIESEERYAAYLANQLISEYEAIMLKHMMNPGLKPHQIQDIHLRMCKYLASLLESVLDFSAKMSSVHTTAAAALKSELERKMKELQIKVANTPTISTLTTTRVAEAPTYLNLPNHQDGGGVPSQGKSQLGSPPPLNTMQACMLNYQKWIDPKWQNVGSHQGLERLHQEAVTRATASLNGEDMAIVKHNLDRYFAHLSELFEGASSSSSSSSAKKCMYIHLTRLGMQFGLQWTDKAPAKKGWKFDKCSAVKTILFTSASQKALGKILSHPRNRNEKETKLLVKVLRKVKEEGENVGGQLNQLLMIIPSWLSLEQRSAIRNLAHETGFLKAFLVSEAALAAYSLLSTNSKADSSVVGISPGLSGIQIGIYARDKETPKSVKLLAGADYHWDLEDSVQKPSAGKLRNVFLCRFYGSSGKSFVATMNPENPGRILVTIHAQAVNQVPEYQAEKNGCFLLSESQYWLEAYKTFCQGSKLAQTSVGDTDLLKAAIQLSSEQGPQNIFKLIIDHPIRVTKEIGVEITMAGQGQVKETRIALEPTTSSKTRDANMTRNSLLNKCKQMRDQLEKGEVRLGVLLMKLVGQSIEKAESLATNANASLDQLMEENAKLVQVIKQHNFAINE